MVHAFVLAGRTWPFQGDSKKRQSTHFSAVVMVVVMVL